MSKPEATPIGGAPAPELAPVPWIRELLRRLRRNIGWHDCFGKAAELAFFFQLAIFPLLIVLLSIIRFLPNAQQTILFWLGRLMPAEAASVVETWTENFLGRQSGGILSFSLLFAIWSASTGARTLIVALNRAYDVEEGRPLWRAQLLAIALVIALAVLVFGGVLIITFGDEILGALAWVAGLSAPQPGGGLLWRFFHYGTGLLMLFCGVGVIYRFAPNVEHDWRSVIPGSVFAIVAIIAASFLLSLYLRYAPGHHAVYGSLGAVVVLMLWLYLVSLMLYLGGEINSEIRKLLGKPAPQKNFRSQR